MKELTTNQKLVKVCFEKDIFSINTQPGNFPINIHWEELRENKEILDVFASHITNGLGEKKIGLVFVVHDDGANAFGITKAIIPVMKTDLTKKKLDTMLDLNETKTGVIFGFVKQPKNLETIRKKIVLINGNQIFATALVNFYKEEIPGVHSLLNYQNDVVAMFEAERDFAFEQGLNSRAITALRLFKEKWSATYVVPKKPKRTPGELNIAGSSPGDNSDLRKK